MSLQNNQKEEGEMICAHKKVTY